MTAKRNKAHMDADAVARMMAAQDQDEAPPEAEPVPSPIGPRPAIEKPEAPTFDPGKVDGRTLRRTGREPFATRIKPETHETLRRIAYERGITISEAVEQAVVMLSER